MVTSGIVPKWEINVHLTFLDSRFLEHEESRISTEKGMIILVTHFPAYLAKNHELFSALLGFPFPFHGKQSLSQRAKKRADRRCKCGNSATSGQDDFHLHWLYSESEWKIVLFSACPKMHIAFITFVHSSVNVFSRKWHRVTKRLLPKLDRLRFPVFVLKNASSHSSELYCVGPFF